MTDDSTGLAAKPDTIGLSVQADDVQQEDGLVLAPEAQDRWVEHLGAVHSIEFNLLSIAISVTASATPIVLAYLYQLPPACETTQQSTQAVPCIPNSAYVGLPLAPLAIVLFYLYLFLNSRIVGKYGRELERVLSASLTPAGDRPEARPPLAFPALSRLNGALYGGESRSLVPFRIVYLLFAVVLIGVEIVTVFLLLDRITIVDLRWWSTAVYAVLIAVALGAFGFGAAHTAWDDLKTAVIDRDLRKALPYVASMSWAKYLRDALFPRPLSALKGLDGVVVLVAAAGLGHWPGWLPTLWTLLGLLLFELVLYQTRYFLNGGREGGDEDRATTRFRLPADVRSNPEAPYDPMQRLLVPFVGLARICLFAWLAELSGLLSTRESWVVAGFFLAVCYLYEVPREAARAVLRRNVGLALDADGTEDGQDLRVIQLSGQFVDGRAARALGWLLFVSVGGGYALRAGFVLYLIDPALLRSWVGIALVAANWAIGCAQVSAGWVIEFLGAWSKPGAGASRVHVGVVAKPQLLWAIRRLPGVVELPTPLGLLTAEESRKREPFPSRGEWRDRVAPWSLAAVVAAGLALSIALTRPGAQPAAVVAAMVVVVVATLLPGRMILLGQWPAPSAAILSALVALLAGYGLPWPFVLTLAGLVFLPQFKLAASRSARLQQWMEAAQKVWSRLGLPFRVAGRAFVGLVELVFGYPVAHPFAGRFPTRRSGWL